jgi:MFS family permease
LSATPPASSFTLPATWPFDVRKTPFFYGWVIWVMSTLGFLMSVPGQTMGMAVFTDPFMVAFDLSRTELSTAYFFGTLGSSLFLTRAGRWYDRHQARTMMVGSCLLLSVVLVFISGIDVTIAGLTPSWQNGTGFALILGGYFGVRFAGQGMLTSASRNVLLVWFERRRGLVSGVRGVVASLGFSIAPLILAMMIDVWGWRGSLWVMALGVAGFAAISLLFVRDTPESCGLLPDGAVATAEDVRALPEQDDLTLDQARRTGAFWIYAGSLSMHALFGTAFTFHIVAIFSEAGRDRDEAFGYFLPQAIASMLVNLLASALADRRPLKPFLLLMLLGFLSGAWGLMHLDRVWGYWMLVLGFGAGGGLWGVLSNLAFVRSFGRLHLGEISGLNTSLTVFASAVGPLLFSTGYDWFGTYDAAVALCFGLNGLLLVAAFTLRERSPPG